MCFFTHINTIKILDKTLGKLSCEAHLGTHGALVHVEIKLTDEALQHQSRKIYCHIYNLIFLVPWGQIVWQCAQDCQCFTYMCHQKSQHIQDCFALKPQLILCYLTKTIMFLISYYCVTITHLNICITVNNTTLKRKLSNLKFEPLKVENISGLI